MGRWIVLLLVLLISLGVGYSYGVNPDQYCPASKKENHNIRIKRTLPPDFQLTEEWLRRLYDIATSASLTEGQIHGICGVCLLQTFQMLAELQEYHSHGPLQGGGYFFNTAPDTDPFDSFRQRYPELDTMLTDAATAYGPAYNTTRLLTLVSAMTMMPQYEWTPSREFTTRSDMHSHIRSLIDSPPGSIWLGLIQRRESDETLRWHALPILRTSQGLIVIQTRVSTMSFELYRLYLTPSTSIVQIINDYLEEADRTLTVLVTIQLEQAYQNLFDFMVSNMNCTGEGENRRGSGGYPTSATVNQCSGGRCALPNW
ncbi:PF07598 domain protein [Leptospira interrogans serovar Grippotyphosa str. UI 12769]|uniref:DUF1561 family protein n=1 Tax=Leptospira interrogans TaxID=173 RepID=UPI00027861FA|nr:DUF1561 family protein [Leptospira interrogans]EMN71047.1 PF07598 domain protein [Leptospira interrogans serovar Bataviae str. UI 08561]AJR15693.1 hypothetical protein LIL_13091 [Leptospira interrogans serovar Linhai str. 56609]EJP16710.1 PF07598 domain protein [Leptospira interrogans str. FPW2026]EKR43342.1 PF07598 domain protein [Leptospira interrogans serovar Grippotyphosa str. UI 08368]EMN64914.1 PF07598 domain protein [Leptospira interrogans serovar Grippotyphosa str. UI 08434]